MVCEVGIFVQMCVSANECKSVPSLFRGWGPDGGDGQGESQESWEADPAADGQMGWQGKERVTPLSPREHNAHAWAPDLSIVPAPSPPGCQGLAERDHQS